MIRVFTDIDCWGLSGEVLELERSQESQGFLLEVMANFGLWLLRWKRSQQLFCHRILLLVVMEYCIC